MELTILFFNFELKHNLTLTKLMCMIYLLKYHKNLLTRDILSVYWSRVKKDYSHL